MTTPDNTNPEATVPESSEKAVANPATQTLFRFVSLRNPQLTETRIENIGFIHRPNTKELRGYFDEILVGWTPESGKTKFQMLEAAAAKFEDQAFTKEKDLELFRPYYELGRYLSKNETVDAKSYSGIDNDKLSKLWDNLIYQVVTQKDFYIKEAIIQTLKAVHYTKHNSDESTAEQAKNAKVVLPAKLFVEDAPVTDEEDEEEALFTVGETEIGSQDHIAETGGGTKATRSANSVAPRSLSVAQESRLKVNAEKNLQVTKALLKKEMLQTLKKELEKLQKSYSKAYYKTYNNELATYQAGAQPIIERNNNLIDELEATFDATTTEAVKKQAYENLELADVPRFEFTYKSEINFPDLKAKLSSESFNLLLEQVAEYNADKVAKNAEGRQSDQEADLQILSDTELSIDGESVVISEDFTSYQEIFAKLDEEISAQSKAALSAVDMPKKQYVNLGGALVPIYKTVNKNTEVCTLVFFETSGGFFGPKNYNFNFSLEVENQSWGIETIKFSCNGIEKTYANIDVVDDKLIINNVMDSSFRDFADIAITCYFKNGSIGTASITTYMDGNDGIMFFPFTISKDSTSSPASFTPKHFGVKRLGIADYLKVEQSIHAYVPGEVSNIENVMASELRHKSSVARDYSEITDTTSKSQETEKMSDTTKTSRTDMQTEVAKEIDKQQSIEAHTSFSAGGAKWKLEVGGSYANSTAQHDSTRQAVAKSQELTERAMERVLTKISEERVQKIIKEYTETNVHEFDNRGKATVAGTQTATPQHITGVYRWVDKKMKNQIYNYGKRTMFEFMIPEPARLHKLALGATKNNILTAPIDPRDAEGEHNMTSNNITDANLQYWAKEYKVALSANPYRQKDIHFNFDGNQSNSTQLPTDLMCTKAHVMVQYQVKSFHSGDVNVDNFRGGFVHISYYGQEYDVLDLELTGTVNVNYSISEIKSINIYTTFYCETTRDIMNQWRLTNFNAIIDAYTTAKAAFEKAQADADAQAAADAAANKEKVSLYYRDMEAEVLKHNCIAYLLQDLGGYGAVGTDLTNGLQTVTDFAVRFDGDLDAYTSLAKFMEQAMEWSVMDYTFYPYYWGNKANWQEMYLSSDLDPLFRNFLQAGMARVIVTVKPGFEDAVQFFMSTGKIWNGGEVPVIGDPMYLSIVDEMREPTGKAQGNYWITRVPTALTILQAGSVGLKVDDALPIFKEDHPEECENPLELETASAFGKPIDAVMQGSTLPTTLPNTIVRPI